MSDLLRKITALEEQKKNHKRVNVYLDGRYAFGLQAMLAATLRVGQMLSPEEIAQLQERDLVEVAHDRALSFLTYRPRSRAEMEAYLQRRKVTPDVIQTVIGRLLEAGLLDDEAFAKYWVENRELFRPRGPHSLRFELWRKGVADAIISDALEDIDETKSAYQAARRKARTMRSLDRETFRRRLGGFLQRRGFSYDTVKETVDRLWRELQASAGEDLS